MLHNIYLRRFSQTTDFMIFVKGNQKNESKTGGKLPVRISQWQDVDVIFVEYIGILIGVLQQFVHQIGYGTWTCLKINFKCVLKRQKAKAKHCRI